MNIIFYISLLIIFFLIIYITFVYYSIFNKNKKNNKNHNNKNHTCDKISCGALDPVSDPKYNMQQIVKQSILLEEHLINKNKRCRDCITKHFQHIIGLAEEAQMLATDKSSKYPLLNDSVEVYNNLFNYWMKYRYEDIKIYEVADKLRIHRKKLIAIYFFEDDYNIKNFSTSSQG
jgi:hypothetical protein